MIVRHFITEPKTLTDDTNWKTGSIPPRYAPIFAKTKPMGRSWEWRSARASAADGDYVLLAQCNPNKMNWKAVLIRIDETGASAVSRFEDHAGHSGLHVHAHCGRSGVEIGATSLDFLARIPAKGTRHRRRTAWTKRTFWEAAKRFFRIEDPKGDLI